MEYNTHFVDEMVSWTKFVAHFVFVLQSMCSTAKGALLPLRSLHDKKHEGGVFRRDATQVHRSGTIFEGRAKEENTIRISPTRWYPDVMTLRKERYVLVILIMSIELTALSMGYHDAVVPVILRLNKDMRCKCCAHAEDDVN